MAKKTAVLTCPGCGTVVEMEYGLFKKTMMCPNCGKHKLDIRTDALQTVICPHCKNKVIYDARKGPGQQCPSCHKPLQGKAEERNFETVACPHCGVVNEVPKGESEFKCISCGRRVETQSVLNKESAKNAQTAYVIKAPEDRDFLIWRHPLDRFPYASRIVVPDGVTALLLKNGVCNAPTQPGSYLLQESLLSLGEQLESAVNDPDQQITVDVYYVNSQINKSIPWGEPQTEMRSADGKTWGTLSTVGRVRVRVVNALALARFLNYEAGKEDELLWVRAGSGDNAWRVDCSKLMGEIRIQTFEGVNAAARDLSNANSWDMGDLKLHRSEIEREAKSYVNDRLYDIGLEIATLTIENVDFHEAEDSLKQKREANAQANIAQDIVAAAEQMNNWESEPLPVHQKGDPTLSADLTLYGSFKLRVVDRATLFSRSEVQQWMKAQAGSMEVRRFFAAQVGEAMKNVFTDVLQPMIDETGADVRELHRYFGYLRNSIQGCLNRGLSAYGMEVEQFTLAQKALRKSEPLEKLTSFAVHRSEAEMEQQAREFERRMNERDSADEYRHGLEINRQGNQNRVDVARDNSAADGAMSEIELDAMRRDLANAETADDIRLHREQHDDVNAEARAEMERRAFERKRDLERAMGEKQREIDLLRRSWQEADEDAMEARGFIRKKTQLTNEAELDALTDDIRKSAKLRSVEEMRAEWEARQRLAEEQLDAEIRRRQAVTDADIDISARKQQGEIERDKRAQVADLDAAERAAEAKRRDALENEENRRLINDILRRIAESDLDLRQKVEAYDRLVRNTEASDARENYVGDAKAKAEADYAVGHTKLKLTGEEQELAELLAKLTEERDERRKEAELRREEVRRQAQFQMELERQRTQVANEMARLKAEYDQKNIEDQMRERLENQDKEIEKLKLTLDYYEKKGDQGVTIERARQEAETARKQAEFAYREKHETMEAEREERRAQERYEQEKGFTEQSAKLLTRMWEIQEAMKKLEFETEQKKNAGVAEVQKAQAQAMAEGMRHQESSAHREEARRLDELVKSIETLNASLRESMKRMGKDIRHEIRDGFKDQARRDEEKEKEKDRAKDRDRTYYGWNYSVSQGKSGGSQGHSDGSQSYSGGGQSYGSGGYGGSQGYDPGGQEQQPGTGGVSVCPKCGGPIGKFDTFCPRCRTYIG